MADVKMAVEVGLANRTHSRTTENYANLPNRDMTNRQAIQDDQAARATRASQAGAQVEVQGASVNVLA